MASLAIRLATPAEQWAVRDLLSSRDERSWSDAQTEWFVFGLDPRRCLAWIAWDQERPVGLTTLFLRELNVEGRPRNAGYWANLYVLPEYREHMLYPRLPFAMLKGIGDAGVAFLYSANRLPTLSLAHQRLGFAHVGKLELLAKPLRPARLVIRYRGWGPSLALLGAPLDLAYGTYLAARRRRAPSGVTVERPAWSRDLAAQLVRGLDSWSKARLRQAWNAESLLFRYRTTREGTSYHAVVARSEKELLGFAVYRIAERGRGVRVGVLMDLAARDESRVTLGPVLDEAERHAASLGADAMLALCVPGAPLRALLRAQGYRSTREVYDMLVWPKSEAAPGSAAADLPSWHFSFADHDAF